jgi:subtilase family serine protease
MKWNCYSHLFSAARLIDSPAPRTMSRRCFSLSLAILASVLYFQPFPSLAQEMLAQEKHAVKGHLHPLARPENDRGPAEPTLVLHSMRLAIQRTPAQQTALDQLLEQQQDRKSPLYHHWLTPEAFADRFGATRQDIARLTQWLESNGFTVSVSRARDAVVFNGTVAQVEQALRTPIHRYQVNGEHHFANSSEPSVPAELEPLVAGFHGLNDFYPKAPRHRNALPPVRLPANPSPDFYYKQYPGVNIMAPADLSTIYNINALYNAGIDGTGLTLAVAGASDIDMSDIQSFRTAFGLPTNLPTQILVPGSQDPGVNGAEGEADLDLEWAGAVARNASILYVNSQDPLFGSAFYVIDEALAPVLTYSFGLCELHWPSNDLQQMASEAQKASAEGITWLASSGDSGAAGCEDQNGQYTAAITRMSVNAPANLPNVTAVGGTEFNQSSSYWGSLHSNLGSALSYIPESGWNDEAILQQNNMSGFAASGGGASWYFSKPVWQSGTGVPADGARDVPDVALAASWFNTPYALISEGQLYPNGGTSAAAPSFAGIVLLLNHYLVATGAQANPGLGNINPDLYYLANNVPNVFHDIKAGSNIVPCVVNSTQDCTGGSMGYTSGSGYDRITGLGSVDAFNLASNWPTAGNPTPHLVVTTFTTSTTATVGGSMTMDLVIANQGQADAGAFEMRAYFTTDGTIATANQFYLLCDPKSLSAGSSYKCSGSVTLGPSITAGKYLMLAVADAKGQVLETDPSGGTALASTGPLTVR